MKKMKNLLTMILLSLTMCVTSCDNSVGVPDKPAEPEVTLEDALNDGTVVAFTFNLNDEEFYVAFVRVGDTVKEKKTSGLVLTAVIDIKQSTMEVTPGDPKYKISGVKMKVSNVEITNLLKKKGEGVTLTDALVKGAKVEVSYYWERSKTPTVFTFTNEGGTFSCKTTGYNNDTFEKGSLRSEGNLLRFSVINNVNPYCSLEIDFNVPNMSYKFFTVFHDYYDSFNISVNDTDITSNIKRE